MSNITPFDFNGHQMRTLRDEQDRIWFVAADVAKALEYREAWVMTRLLADDEKGPQTVSTPGGDQQMTIINEPGLYRAIFSSRSERAEQFRRWVFHEVLPSIRQTGGYGKPTMELPKERRTASLQALVYLTGGRREVMERRLGRMLTIAAMTMGHTAHLADTEDQIDVDGNVIGQDWHMTPETALALLVQDPRFFPDTGDQPDHRQAKALENLQQVRHYLYASALDGREGYALEAYEHEKDAIEEPGPDQLAKALASPRLVDMCKAQQQFFNGHIEWPEYQQRLKEAAALPDATKELPALT